MDKLTEINTFRVRKINLTLAKWALSSLNVESLQEVIGKILIDFCAEESLQTLILCDDRNTTISSSIQCSVKVYSGPVVNQTYGTL